LDTTWTTDGTVVVEHGKTYRFFVRTLDDANNGEYNLNLVAATADCEAPSACIDYPTTGGSYGLNNNLTVIASSPDADIAGATLMVRDSDMGSGVAGPWIALVAMTQVGAGSQQFTATVTNAMMLGVFPTATGDDEYEFTVVCADGLGNTQSNAESVAACFSGTPFSFTWFYTGLPTTLVDVNGDVSPTDPTCGYDVTKDANNTFTVDIPGHVAGRTYTFDVFHAVFGHGGQQNLLSGRCRDDSVHD